jgi:predicted Rossmann fold nucleotide-binding protein DprA/Smf involved in DNA uptake
MKQTRSKPQSQQIETAAGDVLCIGNARVLNGKKLSLIRSQKCPGDVILKTYDFVRLVRRSGFAVVSGFHSPIEKDCLPVLLRGSDPIVIVQAHRLSTSRLPIDWLRAIDGGRLLILSPLGLKDKRVTTELATERNRFVAAISDEVLIPYAAPGSKTEADALSLLAAGKRVCTFTDRPGSLLDAGATVVMPNYFASRATLLAPMGGEQ